MEKKVILQIEKGRIQYQDKLLFKDLDFTIRQGETWALTGESGSGKTSLLKALAGQLPITGGKWDTAFNRQMVCLVEARHRFTNLSHTTTFYYQQRYNSCDAEDAPTVSEVLQQEENTTAPFGWTRSRVIEACRLEHLLEKTVILLSNGETRRLLIAIALIRNPALLLLDNPTSGLDKGARKEIEQVLSDVVASGIHIVLSVSNRELPVPVTHIAHLKNGQLHSVANRDEYLQRAAHHHQENKHQEGLNAWLQLGQFPDISELVEIRNGRVQYGSRVILEDINWKIERGERWAVSGANGAGKSTLLSLITGDNPQAYANNILLFGKKRGTGESIWEIKRKIGFVSPELFQYFPQDTTVTQAVESGFYDTIGLYRAPVAANAAMIQAILLALGINAYASERLQKVATSVQRLTLVARALVKFPPLLILDEPCQGLDENQTEQFKFLIDEICRRTPISLIYVSHYTDEIPASVNRQLELDNGKSVTLLHS